MERFSIQYSGLSIGNHQFEYIIDDEFFKHFEQSDIHHGIVNVYVELEKHEHMLVLDFDLIGKVTVPCDRCGDAVDVLIQSEQQMIYKFGEAYEEEDDNLIILPEDEHQLNIGDIIYEFIVLGVPYRCVHGEDDNGDSLCNKEALKRLNELSRKDQVDPRWEALKKFNIDNQ